MYTKGKRPNELIQNARKLDGVLQVYLELNYLKRLYRQGWRKRGMSEEKCESVADHILGVAYLAGMISETYFPDLDQNKVLKLALVHDIGEIYAGDITPYDHVSAEDKSTREREAIQEIFSPLPHASEYLKLWEEYEYSTSAEARLVKEVDKLEMAVQAGIYYNEGLISLEHKDDFFRTAIEKVSIPKLKELVEEL